MRKERGLVLTILIGLSTAHQHYIKLSLSTALPTSPMASNGKQASFKHTLQDRIESCRGIHGVDFQGGVTSCVPVRRFENFRTSTHLSHIRPIRPVGQRYARRNLLICSPRGERSCSLRANHVGYLQTGQYTQDVFPPTYSTQNLSQHQLVQLNSW